jgi:beta-lactamase class A
MMAATLSGTQRSLESLASGFDGRVGICALDLAGAEPACVNGTQGFPLQSVMKLVVAAAVLDAADRRQLRLGDAVVVRPEDGSPGPQELVDLARRQGKVATTVEDLLRRAIVDSDSTSVDLLLERLGGIAAVHDFLVRKHVDGLRIDRNERQLQAESVGLAWRPGYADSTKFEAAVKALAPAKHDAAAEAYLKDRRDTATPLGMARFLEALVAGRVLSAESTRHLLAVMAKTATGVDRLKAGTPKGWELAHKTGTGRLWQGVRSATNDVGILTASGGRRIAIAVFVSGSRRSDAEQAALIAAVARIVTEAGAR